MDCFDGSGFQVVQVAVRKKWEKEKMKILYLSCHAVLEYDELKLLTEMGHDVFSIGAYSNPQQHGLARPNIPEMRYHADLHNIALQGGQENIHPKLIEWADVIISMHNARVRVEDHPQAWIANNWERMRHKPVIWRSIGQSVQEVEESLRPFRDQGLRIVRYSPKETNIPGYVGGDTVIRFYKSEAEFKDWVGFKRQVITFTQSFSDRKDHLHYDLWMKVTEGFQRVVFGIGNEDLGDLWGGALPYEEMKKQFSENAVYMYTGTSPASYTLSFMEAWMSGIPVVAVGPKIANKIYNMDTYEVSDLIRNGVDGFWSDDVNELRGYIKKLIDDEHLAREIGQAGRQSAINHFGKFTIARQWQDYLSTIGKV